MDDVSDSVSVNYEDTNSRNDWFHTYYDATTVPMFNCKPQVRRQVHWNNTNTSSYMERGDMKWLLAKDRSRHIVLTTVSAFGYEFRLDKAEHNSISQIFAVIKMNINKYRNSINSTGSGNPILSRFVKFRRELSFFLHNFKSHFASMSKTPDNAELASVVLEEIKKLCLFVGRLSQCEFVQHQVTTVFSDTALHYYHMIMDIWWLAFEIAHISESCELSPADPQLVRDARFMGSFGCQLEKALLADLVILGLQIFKQCLSSANLFINHFQCDCIQELYTMLRIFIDHNHQDDIGHFWKSINSTISMMSGKDNSNPAYCRYIAVFPVDIDCKDFSRELFSVWLSSGLSNVYQYSLRGKLDEKKPIVSNDAIYPTIATMIKAEDTQNRQRGISNNVKYGLIYSLGLSDLWEPNIELVLPFLEYYYKRLNKLDSTGFPASDSTTQSVPKNSLNWIQTITKQAPSDLNEFDYFNFLTRLMKTTLAKLIESKNSQAMSHIQRLKARLYSQIHPRRLDELSEVGLYKFVTFFLVFMSTAPEYWTELCGKILEITKFVVQRFLDHPKTALIFKGLFAQLRIKPAECDHGRVVAFISVIAERIVTTAISAEVQAHSRQHDSLVRNLFVYLEEVRLFPVVGCGDGSNSVVAATQNEKSVAKDTAAVLRKELSNLLFKLMEKLIFADVPTTKKIKELMQIFFEDMRQDSQNGSWINEWAMPFFRTFISTYLGQSANGRLFKALEVAISLCPEVVRGSETIYCLLSKAISKVENERKIGTDEELRRLLRELVRKSART